MAQAIIAHATRGDVGQLFRLLNWWALTQDLGILVSSKSDRLELTREGILHVPGSVSPEVLERTTYHDGSKVAKLVFTLKGRNDWLYRMFRNHDYAVALLGIDETGQVWMHFTPPDYANKSIGDCEKWLCGSRAGEDVQIIF